MKSVVQLDISVPQATVAELFADPANNPKWMDDLARVEPINGELGQPGSVFRLVPKRGSMAFVATVLSRDLPKKVRLSLDQPSVSVAVADKFVALSPHKTRLISEESFRFKGVFSNIVGLLARWRIKHAHRRHMESFKRFAEREGQGDRGLNSGARRDSPTFDLPTNQRSLNHKS